MSATGRAQTGLHAAASAVAAVVGVAALVAVVAACSLCFSVLFQL